MMDDIFSSYIFNNIRPLLSKKRLSPARLNAYRHYISLLISCSVIDPDQSREALEIDRRRVSLQYAWFFKDTVSLN